MRAPRASRPLRAAAVTLLTLSVIHGSASYAGWRVVPRGLRAIMAPLAPFQVVNNYGLFAVMTTTRPEIVIEGSEDGVTWKPYEFRWKPGDLRTPPHWVAPHQPRLDWQLWFAALGEYETTPWFGGLLGHLATRRREGLSWKREELGPYGPVLSLRRPAPESGPGQEVP